MSVVLILVLLGVGWLIFSRVTNAVSDRAGRAAGAFVDRRLASRTARLRGGPGYEAGAVAHGTQRLQAGMIDIGGALVFSLIFELLNGLEQATYYDPMTGDVSSKTTEHFSFGLFLLFAVAFYAGFGFLAAWRTRNGQTFGQKFFDYAPRTSGGAQPSPGELFKRHLLRVAAGPKAVSDAIGGRPVEALHDEWTQTKAVRLGDPAPVTPQVGQA